jgi:hypothetical protein
MPKKIRNKPTKCIEYFIHHGRGWNGAMRGKGYVQFEGEYINLSMVQLYTGLSFGFVSKVFNGKKSPGLYACIKLATALGMDLGCFVEAIVTRFPDAHVHKSYKHHSLSSTSASVLEVPPQQ